MKEIYLTQGKVTQVDDSDFNWLMRYKWYAYLGYGKIWYAERGKYICEKHYTIRIHREIFLINNIKTSYEIDHIDGNGLNNQKYNLRAATRSQNSINRGLNSNNTSGFKGVYYYRTRMKFRAMIGYQGERLHIGYFNDPIDAAVEYDRYAKRLFKEYAWLNFPEV
jgi:hypothetical protein